MVADVCACDEGTVCQAHRDTRWDPSYFDTDDTPQEEPERPSPAELKIVDG